MIGGVFCVHDVKAEMYGLPFVAVSDVVAQRQVAGAMSNGEHMWAKFPGDFRLFRIGHYDDSNGQLAPEFPPAFICELSTLKEIK